MISKSSYIKYALGNQVKQQAITKKYHQMQANNNPQKQKIIRNP